ncbi:uncharacterized protein [Haliotis asinina]|uniref:uncharacterized protein n=1 Tax=Haliotis asinina TaxID=109174 RepID=UPI0035318270
MTTSSDRQNLIQMEEDEEEDFELTQHRIEAERAVREEEALERNTLKLDIPKLPDGKTHHLFISHSNDPSDEEAWAEELVNTMERDFGLKCLWPKRDFTPGRDLGSLIQEGILCSMKVVFVMTPEAVNSGWCKYERNLAFGISVDSPENLIIPVKLKECEFPGIMRTMNYVDVTAGEDYVFRIRRSFDEDTFDLKHLVPEVNRRDKGAEQLNGRMVQIRGEQVFRSCRGSAWWFPSLDQHQRYQLRQLGSKFAERTYYEARDVINKSFRMKYFSIFSSGGRCCSWCFISLVLWFLLVAFALALIHTKQNHLFDTTFMWFGIFPGLLFVQIFLFCITRRLSERKMKRWVCNYSLGHVLKTNIFIHFDFTNPSMSIMYYNVKPCLEFICEKMHEIVDSDGSLRDKNTEETAQTMGRRKFFSFIEENYEALFSFNINASIVRRHPTFYEKKCICEMMEKRMMLKKQKT